MTEARQMFLRIKARREPGVRGWLRYLRLRAFGGAVSDLSYEWLDSEGRPLGVRIRGEA